MIEEARRLEDKEVRLLRHLVDEAADGDKLDAIFRWAKADRRSFRGAVTYWRLFGSLHEISAYLRSEQPLSAEARNWLADFVDGKIRLPRGRPPGARKDSDLQYALALAAFDVKELISEWTAAGESRRGLNAKAIEAAAAERCPAGMGPAEFQEKLATFIARAKR